MPHTPPSDAEARRNIAPVICYRTDTLPQPDLPVTERVAARSLSLPIWSHMPLETVECICAAMARLHAHAEEVREALGD